MKNTPNFVYLQAYADHIAENARLNPIKASSESSYANFTYRDPIVKKPRKPTLLMTFRGKLVRAKLINQNKQPFKRGRRSVITDFSRGSRGRLFDLFNSFEVKHAATFITLTYTSCSNTQYEAKSHLRAFLKRLERMYPKHTITGVWRMEFQERGAIHFHLVLFECPYVPKETIQTMWAEITHDNRPFTRIERIFSHKKIINYVAKYVGKVNPQGEDSGFNSPTYLSAYQKYHGQKIGRVWGYLNKKDLPFAELTELELPLYWSKFVEFRRAAVRFYPALDRNLSPGFKLYVHSASAWEKMFHAIYDIQF